VIVAGLAGGDGAPPRFPGGSSFVYEDHLLLRSAVAVLGAASGGGWSVPADVPRLVAEVYGGASIVPDTWTEAAEKAHLKADEDASIRAARAAQFLLAGEDKLGTPTLAGLHDLSSNADLDDETRVAAVVRDGEPSVEVVLVRRDDVGYRALDGTRMGVNGEAVSDADVAELVVRCSVRLPAYGDLTRDALDQLQPLPGWGTHPWLRRARALVLDETGRTTLGRHRLTYDDDLGLVVERAR
jgi:CRISPR-associated endonuclease/helicase Cas3